MPDPQEQATPGCGISIEIDGEGADARAGESLAAALLAGRGPSRQRRWRRVFCNMGVCGDCSVVVLGPHGERVSRRACLTIVAQGMRVFTTGDGTGG